MRRELARAVGGVAHAFAFAFASVARRFASRVSPARARAMGGHGGLNILPHKSWNVYGAKQRQRVERDERIARERAEAERRELDDAARDERWRALGASATDRNDASGHVNLFAREEAAATRAEREGARARAEAEASGTAFAGGASRDARKPWYARSLEREVDVEESRSLPSRVRRDREEDEALRRLTRRLGSRAEDDAWERKREKKRERGERRDEKRRESSRNEMERLRRERLERESKEMERERELLAKRVRR